MKKEKERIKRKRLKGNRQKKDRKRREKEMKITENLKNVIKLALLCSIF